MRAEHEKYARLVKLSGAGAKLVVDTGHAITREVVHEDQATFPTPTDRERFEQVLTKLDLKRPPNGVARSPPILSKA